MLRQADSKWILLLVIVQLIVCLPVITAFPIALDEPFSIFHSQKSWEEMKTIFVTENNPPLHFLLLHFWMKLFGSSALAVRSLSLLFSLITIPVIFKLFKKLCSLPVAITGVLFFIFSSFQHYHAMEARVYALFVLLFALILLDLYRFLFESNKWSFARLVIWNAGLLYAHYLGIFILGVEGLIVLLFIKQMNRQKWLQFLLAFGIIIVAYLPGLQLMVTRATHFSAQGTWVPPAQYSELYGNILRFYNHSFVMPVIVVLLLVGSFVFGYKWWKGKEVGALLKAENRFILLSFLIPYLGMFIISKVVEPVFLDRYLLFTTIPLYLIPLLIAEQVLKDKNKALALVLLIPFIIPFKWLPDNNREPDVAANWIKERSEGKTSILICPPFYDLTFSYHYNRTWFEQPEKLDNLFAENGVQTLYHAENLVVSEDTKTLFFIDSDAAFLFPDNGILKSLLETHNLVDSSSFKGSLRVYQFN